MKFPTYAKTNIIPFNPCRHAPVCVCVMYAITRLSVPNSCRSGVDVYWTNLSRARIVFRAFNETRSFAARLNQIPKYPKNFWRGEEKAIGPAAKCKFLLAHIFLCLSLFLSFFSLHRTKTWTEYPPFPKFFCYCFHSIEAWRFIAFLPPCEHPAITSTWRTTDFHVDIWIRKAYIELTFDWPVTRCSLCGFTHWSYYSKLSKYKIDAAVKEIFYRSE